MRTQQEQEQDEKSMKKNHNSGLLNVYFCSSSRMLNRSLTLIFVVFSLLAALSKIASLLVKANSQHKLTRSSRVSEMSVTF